MPRGTFQFGKARGSVSSFICNLQTAIFVVVIEQKKPKQTHVVPYHFLTEKGFQRFKCQFKNTYILQVKKVTQLICGTALGMPMSVSPSLWSREKYPCLMDCYEIAQRYALFPDDESGWLLDCKTSRNMVHISMLPVPYIKRLWSSFNCSSWNTSKCLTFSAIAWQHWDGQPYS